jgi:ubiquinone biosynthesis accessory factor UbiJ
LLCSPIDLLRKFVLTSNSSLNLDCDAHVPEGRCASRPAFSLDFNYNTPFATDLIYFLINLTDMLYYLEKLLNHYVQLDPESQEALTPLDGTSLAFESIGFCCYCCITSNTIYLKTEAPPRVDVTLRASPWDYWCLATQAHPSYTNIHISGNLETASAFQKFLKCLAIDWEAQLARIVGDSASYNLLCFLKSLRHWARHCRVELGLNLTEYLQIESQVLPSRLEVEDFLVDVDHIREKTDRLEAYIRQIQAKLAAESINS